MTTGTKVRLTGIVTSRGTVLESLRGEWEGREIGVVSTGVDASGWVMVKFSSCPGGPLEAPVELLEAVNPRA